MHAGANADTREAVRGKANSATSRSPADAQTLGGQTASSGWLPSCARARWEVPLPHRRVVAQELAHGVHSLTPLAATALMTPSQSQSPS